LSNVALIPHFIEAPNKLELMRSMLDNNIKQGKKFNYFDIQQEGKRWVAWYYNEVKFNGTK